MSRAEARRERLAPPRRALPRKLSLILLPALALLASCAGGSGSGRDLATSSITPENGVALREIIFEHPPDVAPVALPSGAIVACRGISDGKLVVERLTTELASVWATAVPVPLTMRSLAPGEPPRSVPADEVLQIDRAGAAITLLSIRQSGNDSVALVARRLEAESGRLLHDTVTMRRAYDPALPLLFRRPWIARSPKGTRLAVCIRLKSYGVETCDAAIQILDQYLNPLETRKLRVPIVDRDGLLPVQVDDDGTIYLLSRDRGDSVELLRISPGAAAPSRRVAGTTGMGDAVTLHSWIMALGPDGRLRVAAVGLRNDVAAGFAAGTVDFSSEHRSILPYTPFGREPVATAPTTDRIAMIVPAPAGAVLLLGRRDVHEPDAPGADLLVVGVDSAGAARWSHALLRRSAADPTRRADLMGLFDIGPKDIHAEIDMAGNVRILVARNDRHELTLLRGTMPDMDARDGSRPVVETRIGALNASVTPGTLRWIDDRTFVVGTYRYGEQAYTMRLDRVTLPAK